MSAVDRLLWRYGLRWELYPYRIVVDTHPHLVVQPGPSFDLRDSALRGARERVLATQRKRKQRSIASLPDVTPTNQYRASIGGLFSIPAVENRLDAESYGR